MWLRCAALNRTTRGVIAFPGPNTGTRGTRRRLPTSWGPKRAPLRMTLQYREIDKSISGAEARTSFWLIAARLKSCPDASCVFVSVPRQGGELASVTGWPKKQLQMFRLGCASLNMTDAEVIAFPVPTQGNGAPGVAYLASWGPKRAPVRMTLQYREIDKSISGAEARPFFWLFAARLKSCPDASCVFVSVPRQGGNWRL